MLLMFLCCGVPVGMIDRSILLHVYDYEQAAVVNIAGVAVEVDVNPQTRIKTPPERLQGPPYALTMLLRDPSRRAVSATLHSASLELNNGQLLPAK